MLVASIIQRKRGIYLAHVLDGDVEDTDAFPTLVVAKRWCRDWHDRRRIRWQEIRQPGGGWPRWEATIESDE